MSVDWLLNYMGGSFAFKHHPTLEKECKIRGVSTELVPDVVYQKILSDIAKDEVNQSLVKLEKLQRLRFIHQKTRNLGMIQLPW